MRRDQMPPIARPVIAVLLIAIIVVGFIAFNTDTPSVPMISMQPTNVPTATATPLPTALPTVLPTATAQPTLTAAEPTIEPEPCVPVQMIVNGSLNGQVGQLVTAPISTTTIVNNILQTPEHKIGFYPTYAPVSGYPGQGKLSFFDGHVLTIRDQGAPLANISHAKPGDDVIVLCSNGSSVNLKVQQMLFVPSEARFAKPGEKTVSQIMIDIVNNLKGETFVIVSCFGEGYTENNVYSKTHRNVLIAQ
jgi:hypothetical protein